MKRFPSARFVAAATIAGAALGAVTVAQAHTDVHFSFGLPGPVYVEPVPVYVRPEPVYARPRPVYVQPPGFAYERPWRASYESEFERERAWRRAEWQQREWQHRQHGWDRGRSYGRDRDRDRD